MWLRFFTVGVTGKLLNEVRINHMVKNHKSILSVIMTHMNTYKTLIDMSKHTR